MGRSINPTTANGDVGSTDPDFTGWRLGQIAHRNLLLEIGGRYFALAPELTMWLNLFVQSRLNRVPGMS